MEIMASGGAQEAHGTFTGDGTRDASVSIGFEPDVFVITSDLDYATSGWVGAADVVFVKGRVAFIGRHNSTTATSPTNNLNNNISSEDPYGGNSTAGSYCPKATYSNGVLSITNQSAGNGVTYVNGQTYTWQAFKA